MRAPSNSARLIGAIVLAITLLAADTSHLSSQSTSDAPFPSLLNTYISTHVRLTPAERTALVSGSPVTRLLDADPSKEVAVFGAVWVEAPPSTYVRLVKDIEHFEHGGPFLITKRISEPPQLADFAALHLPPQDLDALRTCTPGDCEVKLSAEALERIQKSVDWGKPTARAEAEALFRQVLYEYVLGYTQGGNERLAVYRDSQRPTFVATEFKSMVDRMPELGEYMPDLRSYLLDYPKVTLPNATAFLYWQEVQFGLKPTIRVNHLVIDNKPEFTGIAVKLIYASHYFWTALDLRVLVPDPARGKGFWFVNVTRSRSDGLSGFMGTMVRARVQNEVIKGMEHALKATKAKVEEQQF
jgi:hypothetical protein